MTIGYIPTYYIKNKKTNTYLNDPKRPNVELSFKSTYDHETFKRTNGSTLAKRYLESLPNKEDYVIEKFMIPVE